VHRAQDILNGDNRAINGANVLLLGVTYKPDIADQRESPAVPLAKHLTAKGAVVSFHDPYVESWQVNGSQLLRVDNLDTALSGADLSILLQGHSTYDVEQLATKSRRLLDTRGVVPSAPAVERL
jgi:UDP-N-acetyl-D-mannosaminuronate dehydrogenase